MSAGWQSGTIGDAVGDRGVFSDGDWVESKDQDPGGDVRLIQLADIGDGWFRDRSSRFLTGEKAHELGCTYLRPGDVLVARMPDPLGRACIFPDIGQPAVTAVDVCIIRPGNGSASTRWLMHMVNSPQFRLRISELQSGTTRKRISRKNLATIELPLPPIDEQRRIVDAIETHLSHLDAGVESLERAKRNVERMRAAVLDALAHGDLVEQDSADESATELLHRLGLDIPEEEEQIDSLPAGWVRVFAGDVCDVQGGIQKQPKRTPKEYHFPYLRVANVHRNSLDLSEVHDFELFDGELEKYRLLPGDLLVVEGNGSRAQIGRSALWRGEIENCVHQNHLIRVRPTEAVSPDYLNLYWNAPATASALAQVASSTSGLYTLSTSKVKSVPLALPPRREQDRIVEEAERQLSLLDAIRSEIESGLSRGDSLRRAVLGDAFTGRLTGAVT